MYNLFLLVLHADEENDEIIHKSISSLASLEKLLSQILWFRLHEIAIHWIINITTFVWGSLRCFFCHLATNVFCNNNNFFL